MTLSKAYVEQLSKQLDLQFALTLRFMNEDSTYAKFDKESLDKLLKMPQKEREAVRDQFTEIINQAIAKAKKISQEQRPITAPMEDC